MPIRTQLFFMVLFFGGAGKKKYILNSKCQLELGYLYFLMIFKVWIGSYN